MQRIADGGGISVAHLQIENNDGLVARVPRFVKIPIIATPTGAEQDTGLDLPADCIVLPMIGVRVNTAEAGGGTKTLSFGTLSSESGGVAAGFATGIDVSSTGMKIASLANGAETLGSLLKQVVAGGTAKAPVPYSQSANAAKSISYTAGSNDWTTFRGDLYLFIAPPF